MVATRRSFMRTGRKALGGLAVAQMGAWIMDVIIMGRDRNLVPVIFAGAFFGPFFKMEGIGLILHM
jgi:hypothetical protein